MEYYRKGISVCTKYIKHYHAHWQQPSPSTLSLGLNVQAKLAPRATQERENIKVTARKVHSPLGNATL